MKKYIQLAIWVSIVTLSCISCDINRVPETAISDETFWTRESDFKAAANYFYRSLEVYPTSDNWSDDSYGRSSNPISDGSWIVPSVDGNYNGSYTLIRACNKLLEKADEAKSLLDEGMLNPYRAEARFFRAYAYYNLVSLYGGVPIVLKTLSDDDEELYAPRSSREEVYAQIFEDLEFAEKHLPLPSELPASDYGRITKTAVLSYMARVALYEGTRAKFHGYGDPNVLLKRAKDAAMKVIESQEHSLTKNYFDMFQYAGEESKEHIIVKMYGVDRENYVLTHNYFRGALEQGLINPTKSLVDSYLMSNGLPYNAQNPLYKKPSMSVEIFENRDKRLLGTVFKAGDPFLAPPRDSFVIANLGFNSTGYVFRKFSNMDDWQLQRSTLDYPVLRYAEVLLIYAEATFELNGGSISDMDLDYSVNKLRERAEIPPLSNSFVMANNLQMREEIRRERRVELAQEGFRYYDLIRWKTAEIELPKAVLGIYLFEEEFVDPNVNLTEDNFILATAAENRTFDPSKDYLWPIPTNELALNPALEQNPGWN